MCQVRNGTWVIFHSLYERYPSSTVLLSQSLWNYCLLSHHLWIKGFFSCQSFRALFVIWYTVSNLPRTQIHRTMSIAKERELGKIYWLDQDGHTSQNFLLPSWLALNQLLWLDVSREQTFLGDILQMFKIVPSIWILSRIKPIIPTVSSLSQIRLRICPWTRPIWNKVGLENPLVFLLVGLLRISILSMKR